MYLLFLLVAVLFFLYNSWKALKEDFASQEVIGFIWQLILGMIIISRIGGGDWTEGPWWQILAIWNSMKINYFVGLMGGVLISAFIAKQKKWKLWALLEDISGSFLGFLLIMYLAEIIYSYSLVLLIEIFIIIFGILLTPYLTRKYRSFVWYRSGKKGFVFFALGTVLFFLMALSSFFLQNGQIMAYLYLITSLISGVGLYILGKV
jgi:hypothetical protein